MGTRKRTIKFRAWDAESLMFYQKEMENRLWFVYDELRYPLDAEIAEGHWTIMQYTGLKDKNGVEIYEGDIVKVPHWSDKRRRICGEIKFVDGAFIINLTDMEYIIMVAETIEVIGNIYENKELLKEV